MKIKDILGEDDTMKIKSVSGNDVTIDQGGTEIKTTADTLVPDAAHPGQFQMKPPDPSKIAPGATITPATSEDQGTADTIRQAIISSLFDSELSSEEQQVAQTLIVKDETGKVDGDKTMIKMFRTMRDSIGELINVFNDFIPKCEEYLNSPEFTQQTPENQTKYKQDLADMKVAIVKAQDSWKQQQPELDKSIDDIQSAMAQYPQQEGHKDTIAQGGGDVGGDATDSFINQVRDKGYERKNRGASGVGNKSTLSEKDELYKWLTIAGIK